MIEHDIPPTPSVLPNAISANEQALIDQARAAGKRHGEGIVRVLDGHIAHLRICAAVNQVLLMAQRGAISEMSARDDGDL